MTREGLLDRLASRAGIEPSYFDIFGQWHEASFETKASILSAMGFDVSSIQSLGAAITAKEEDSWRRSLAPVVVKTGDAAGFDLDLFLPVNGPSRYWNWEIACESGETYQDVFRPDDLPVLTAREIDGQRKEHVRLTIRQPLPIGYHRLRIGGERAVEAQLLLAPRRCYVPPHLDVSDGRRWGVSAHLYTLRSERNWGIGDFGDLARLCQLAGQSGASVVATNPFHALFPNRPSDASPYSPSSRLFLNPIYIDVTAVPSLSGCHAAHPANSILSSLRETKLVDYPEVWAAKLHTFEALFNDFQARLAHGTGGHRESADFQNFITEAGPALQRFAAFSVLDEIYCKGAGQGVPWPRWSLRHRVPDSAEVKQVIGDRSDRAMFHQYLQYLADCQLGRAAEEARRAGLDIGLMRDLALGASPDGADTWMQQEVFATDLRCGAPPDDFHPDGQEWGVVPFDPVALRRNYSPFISMLRANMRHAGGLRVDHVIGLQRQFLVPLGERPAQGCYVNFPFQELMAILALESQRNKCMVIGEDLGTVPEGFRDRLREKGAFGCAILYFERTAVGRFKAATEYPKQVAATATTHDLPTLVGYWEGLDIAIRRRVGIYTDADADKALVQRRNDRLQLFDALVAADFPVSPTGDDSPQTALKLVQAVHGFLASSAAQLFLAQLDDLMGEADQINVPGTVDEYPNWRRKLSLDLDDPTFVAAITELARICAAQGRGRPGDDQAQA